MGFPWIVHGGGFAFPAEYNITSILVLTNRIHLVNSLAIKGIGWSLLERRRGIADISLPDIYFSLPFPPGPTWKKPSA